MKIIIRYYSQWGNMSTKTCTISPNIKVAQLKQQIALLTEIPIDDQILILNDQTLDDEHHLFTYNPEENQFVYVNRNNQDDNVESEIPELQKQPTFNRAKGFQKLGIINEDDEEINHKQSMGYNRPQEMALEFIKLVKNNDLPAIQAFLSNHQNQNYDLINDRQLNGFSGFHYANQLGYVELVSYLLEIGADVNLCTKDRQSPLQLALKNYKIECAKLLLTKEVCDVNYISQSKSALQIAVQNGELEIVELILKHPQFDKDSVDTNELKGDQDAIQLVIHHCQKLQQPAIEPNRPKAQKGYIKKLNIMKFFHYKRYLALDPEAGTLTRYKTEADYPLNPIETIALANIKEVWNSKKEWYMKSDHEYLSVSYKKGGDQLLVFCSKSKSTINSWKRSLQDAIQYYVDIERKIAQLTFLGNYQEINNFISTCDPQFNIIADSRCQSLDQQEQVLKVEPIKQVQQSPPQQQNLSPTESQSHSPTNELTQELFKQYLINYTVIKQIGQGAFGKVFLVKYNPTQQIYAMKQLNKRKLVQKKQVKFAMQECDILKQVECPYIVNLFQSFQTQNNLYLVMDYCGGGDLSFHLFKLKTFDENTCKIIIRQVMKAIEYLHQLNIIYRDLKPENVIIDNNHRIKLVDFGLSKQSELGKTSTFCGSPAYLAPEVLNQKGAVQATDVYGIGTVMYELLVGEPPYFSEDLDTLFQNIRNNNLTIPNRLSKPCQSLLQGLLQKESNKRIGCKIPQQVNWNIIKLHEWLEWDNTEEKVNIGNTNENLASVVKNYTHNLGDADYTEDNYKLNRIVGWTFTRNI